MQRNRKQRKGKKTQRKNLKSRRRVRGRKPNIRRRNLIEQAPVQIGFTNKSQAPKISGNGSTKTVVHRELISTLAGSTAFSVITAELNPGLYSSFPWLSNEAITYEMYHWNFLRFIYEPATSTSTTGMVMIAIDFDSLDDSPVNENEVMNHCDAVSGPSWASVNYIVSKVNFDRQFPNKFVRLGTQPEFSDIHSYDLGKFIVATVGQPNTNTIGRIYAEYSVTFMIPALPAQGERGTYDYAEWGPTGVVTAARFGTSLYPTYEVGNLSVQIGSTNSGWSDLTIFGIQPGAKFMLQWRLVGGTVATAPTVTCPAGSSLVISTYMTYSAITGATDLLCQSFWTKLSSASTPTTMRFANTSMASCLFCATLVLLLPMDFDPSAPNPDTDKQLSVEYKDENDKNLESPQSEEEESIDEEELKKTRTKTRLSKPNLGQI